MHACGLGVGSDNRSLGVLLGRMTNAKAIGVSTRPVRTKSFSSDTYSGRRARDFTLGTTRERRSVVTCGYDPWP